MGTRFISKVSVLLVIISYLALIISCSGKIKLKEKAGEQLIGTLTIDEVIDSLTVDEKALLVVGASTVMDIPDLIRDRFFGGANPYSVPEGADPEYAAMLKKLSKRVPGAAGRTAEVPGLLINSMVLTDGPAGLRIHPQRENDTDTYYCTAFPIATALATSWDPELVNRVGQAMGDEALEYGVDILLAPGMNLQRDPLCGRNFEYYSEDPLVTGKMAAAMVKGVQSRGVGTSIKHFAANNQETNRSILNTIVSERALRELYLEGFRIAVEEAQPWTVMSAYNKLNGTYASESYDLLTKILRDEWGFEGFVMTDWGAGSDVVAQINAGNDLIMPGHLEQIKEIVAAVREGRLDENVLDTNLKRILKILVRTPGFRNYEYTNKPDLKAHAEVVRQAAADGMVLLSNRKNALPLDKNIKTIAAFGNASYDPIIGGKGSGYVYKAYSVSLIQGLQNAGYSVDKPLCDVYSRYIQDARANHPAGILAFLAPPIPEMDITEAFINQSANRADVAIITIGRISGEGYDRKAEAGDFYLTEKEKTLIASVSKAFQAKGKIAIVLLNIGGVIETVSWRDLPDAVLLTWQPGQEAGNSVVDILSGRINPSGKLAVTFPVSYSDVPSSKTFPGHSPENVVEPDLSGFSSNKITEWETIYEEDIYVGYRYYNSFNVPVAYEFGYGLSYTQFDYSNLQISSNKFKEKLVVKVDIKNTGNVAGREVVQIYVSAPQNKMEKPNEELVAFGKTRLLQPGETQTLSFEIKPFDLASYDEGISSWVAEAGNYEVKAGASSKDIRQTAGFKLARDVVVKRVNKVLVPQDDINKLKRGN